MALHYQTAIAREPVAARSNEGALDIRPIAGALGAEIHGVDLGRELDAQTVAQLRRALLDHLVIFFRDQEMTPEQHKALGRRFGDLVVHEFVAGIEGHPEIMLIAKEKTDKYNFGGAWHSDITYSETPPLGSILYAKEVPACGGDTLFASMYLAYETLSDTLRATLDPLRAVHSASRIYGRGGEYASRDYQSGHRGTRVSPGDLAEKTAEHPVVRTHPEAGRKALYVNSAFTLRIQGMSEDESRPLLEYLYRHATTPEFTCRFRWQKGSVAFWDNRAVQHYALNDYPGQRRVMHRVTIAGDRPF
jgi:taurine dioxygenase